MDNKFTTKSQEVISAANTNAQTAGNPTIETAHILKALMDQREGVAVAVLKAAGLDVDAISEAASAEIKKLPQGIRCLPCRMPPSAVPRFPLCRRHRPAPRASEIPTFLPK